MDGDAKIYGRQTLRSAQARPPMVRGRELLSRLDLSDAENQRQALHDLRRAEADGSDAAWAGWARNWGEAALLRIING